LTLTIEDIQGQYMGFLKFTPPAWIAVETLLETVGPPVRDRLDVTGLLRRLLTENKLPSVLSPLRADGEKSIIHRRRTPA
jgi:hypothetical protein